MRLRYDKSISTDPAPLVLERADGVRVEIHIRREADQTATLLAFSGREGSSPEKATQQGPYQLYDQAVAAKRAIAAQLKDAGFNITEQQHPLWSMDVQRDINSMRKQKGNSEANYEFDPKDVFLDW